MADQPITAMVSSTFFDLEEHREGILSTLVSLQLTPLAMEFDEALADSDLIKGSLDKVTGAKLYIGVIGSRYGQRPSCAERNKNKLSLTELEYEAAVAKRLPRLMFVMADDHHLTLEDLNRARLEGDEGRLMRDAFIKRVQEDRIAAFFSSPKDLEAKAMRSIVAWLRDLGRFDDKGETRRREPLIVHPYGLLQGQFAGRKQQLRELDEWAAGKWPMMVLEAHGGFGKSALAWTWFRAQMERHPPVWHGMLFFSFYRLTADYESLIVTLYDYGFRSLDSQNDDVQIGAGLKFSEKEKRVRELLTRERFLIILDGFEDQLEAYNRLDANSEHTPHEAGGDQEHFSKIADKRLSSFLKEMLSIDGKSRILVTTRYFPHDFRLGAGYQKGIKVRQLHGLDLEETKEFWSAHNLDPEDPLLPEFTTRMAGYPLALQVTASRMGPLVRTLEKLFKKNPEFNPLRDGITRDEARDDVFRAALISLDDAQRQLLRTLAWLREPPSQDLLGSILCAGGGKRPFATRAALSAQLDDLEQRGVIKNEAGVFEFDWRHKMESANQDAFEGLSEAVDEILRELRWSSSGKTLDDLALMLCENRPFSDADALEACLDRLLERGLIGLELAKSSSQPDRFDLHPVVRGVIKAREANEAAFLTNTSIVEALRAEPRTHMPPESARDLEPRIQLFLSLIEAGRPVEAASDMSDSLNKDLCKFDAQRRRRQLLGEFFNIRRIGGRTEVLFKFNEAEFDFQRMEAASDFSMELAGAAHILQDWELALAGYETHQKAGICKDPLCSCMKIDALEAMGRFATADTVLRESISKARQETRDPSSVYGKSGTSRERGFLERRLARILRDHFAERDEAALVRICIARELKAVRMHGTSILNRDTLMEYMRDSHLGIARLASIEGAFEKALAIAHAVLVESEAEHSVDHLRQALVRCGHSLNKLGRFTEAEDYFERDLDLEPEGPKSFRTIGTRLNLVKSLAGQKRFEDAEQYLEGARVQARDIGNCGLIASSELAAAEFARIFGKGDIEREHLLATIGCFSREEGIPRGPWYLEEALRQLRSGGWHAEADAAASRFITPIPFSNDVINPDDAFKITATEIAFPLDLVKIS